MKTTTPKIKERLEYLRTELRAERISYEELVELQGLAEHIESGDVELLEAAGVPENIKMLALLTVQGAAAQETALCKNCIKKTENKEYARDQAGQSDDVDPKGEFKDCTGNYALECCICEWAE